MSRRKICVITGSRADYGLLFWLMKEIQADSALELQVAVTGMHLAPEHGNTFQQITADGFPISAKVDIELRGDDPVSLCRSMGLGIQGFGEAFAKLRPDVVVVLGDRYEILAAAEAAMFSRLPIAHIHGGEATEGLMDEAIRHSITKMAHFHFVAAEPYRQRVIQLGEDPQRVFNFGAPALDQIRRAKLMPKADWEKSVGLSLRELNFLVTYHPVTLEGGDPTLAFRELLRAFDQFPEVAILFTKANADLGGAAINAVMEEYVKKNPGRTQISAALGQARYFAAISLVDVVVGNSSSGLIEVPSFHKPTVNLGDRQKGRLRPDSVIDCAENATAIEAAIRRAISPEFRAVVAKTRSAYDSGDTASRIYQTLKSSSLDVLMKKFQDVRA